MVNGAKGEARTLSRAELQDRLSRSFRRTGLTVGGERIVRGAGRGLITESEAVNRANEVVVVEPVPVPVVEPVSVPEPVRPVVGIDLFNPQTRAQVESLIRQGVVSSPRDLFNLAALNTPLDEVASGFSRATVLIDGRAFEAVVDSSGRPVQLLGERERDIPGAIPTRVEPFERVSLFGLDASRRNPFVSARVRERLLEPVPSDFGSGLGAVVSLPSVLARGLGAGLAGVVEPFERVPSLFFASRTGRFVLPFVPDDFLLRRQFEQNLADIDSLRGLNVPRAGNVLRTADVSPVEGLSFLTEVVTPLPSARGLSQVADFSRVVGRVAAQPLFDAVLVGRAGRDLFNDLFPPLPSGVRSLRVVADDFGVPRVVGDLPSSVSFADVAPRVPVSPLVGSRGVADRASSGLFGSAFEAGVPVNVLAELDASVRPREFQTLLGVPSQRSRALITESGQFVGFDAPLVDSFDSLSAVQRADSERLIRAIRERQGFNPLFEAGSSPLQRGFGSQFFIDDSVPFALVPNANFVNPAFSGRNLVPFDVDKFIFSSSQDVRGFRVPSDSGLVRFPVDDVGFPNIIFFNQDVSNLFPRANVRPFNADAVINLVNNRVSRAGNLVARFDSPPTFFERSLIDFDSSIVEPPRSLFAPVSPDLVFISQLLPERSFLEITDSGDVIERFVGGDLGFGVPRFGSRSGRSPSAQQLVDESLPVGLGAFYDDFLPVFDIPGVRGRRAQFSLFDVDSSVVSRSPRVPSVSDLSRIDLDGVGRVSLPSERSLLFGRNFSSLFPSSLFRQDSGLLGGLLFGQGLGSLQRVSSRLGVDSSQLVDSGLLFSQGLDSLQRVSSRLNQDSLLIADSLLSTVEPVTQRVVPRPRFPRVREFELSRPRPRVPLPLPDVNLPRGSGSGAAEWRVTVGSPGNVVYRDLGTGGVSLVREAKRLVSESPAASLSAVPVNTAAARRDLLSIVGTKDFKRSKSKKNVVVEKNKSRIDSAGELLGITAKGLASKRRVSQGANRVARDLVSRGVPLRQVRRSLSRGLLDDFL